MSNEDNNDTLDIGGNDSAIVPQNPQSLHVYQKIKDPIEAIKVMGQMIAGSGMFGCQKDEQGMVIAMQCLAEGKSPLELAKTYHIVEGKLAMRADAMLGLFQVRGGQVKWIRRDKEAVESLWSFGKYQKDIPISCTLQEMKDNGVAMDKTGKYLKVNWQRFPRQMLTARVISEGVRLLAPELVSGVYTPEEVSDFDSRQSVPIQQISKPVPIEAEVLPAIQEDKSQAIFKRLDEILGPFEGKANTYLVEKGYIKQGQTYREVSLETATRIVGNPQKLLSLISA